MLRIAFLNQKGGVGKSTVCTLLAAALKVAGFRVAIDDRDVQFTSGSWAREVGEVPLISECEHADAVLCDTPGRLDLQNEQSRSLLAEIVGQCDRAVLVAEKSPFSMRASEPMAAFIRQNLRAGANGCVLFNKVRMSTRIGKMDEGELSGMLGLPALKNSLPLAAPFEQFQTEGFSCVTGRYRERILRLALELTRAPTTSKKGH